MVPVDFGKREPFTGLIAPVLRNQRKPIAAMMA